MKKKISWFELIIIVCVIVIFVKGYNYWNKPEEIPVVISVPTSNVIPCSIVSADELPLAKDIDEALKAQVDELVFAIAGAETWQDRNEALEKLETIMEQNPSDMSLFAYLIQQPNSYVAMVAMVAMGKCQDKDKVSVKFEIYTRAVKHPSDYMRYFAFEHLRDAKTDEEKAKALELAGEALDDPSGHVRGRGCWYIGYVRDNTHNEKLKEIMKTDDAPQAVANAIEALDNSGEDITADIMEIIDDLHPYAKCFAITVLENKKYKDAVPKLVEMLDDTTKTYYKQTFDNGDTMNYNALKPTVQEMAIHGLERITEVKIKGADTAAVVARWKEWPKTGK